MPTPAATCHVTIDGHAYPAQVGEALMTLFARHDIRVPQLCHHENLGPLQTCDTCWVRHDGALVRSCTLQVEPGMTLETTGTARDAQLEGMNRILEKHNLYCTVCDNNNGGCEVHNATDLLDIKHQVYPFQPKPYPIDHSNPFYRYDPSQCILCGRCVEACQNLEVNETLHIDWDREVPRVVWDHDRPIDESSCVSCGQCVSVCPCNALMETTMLGEAGVFTALPEPAKDAMIGAIKMLEPTTGFEPVMLVSKLDAAMRQQEIRRSKTVCTYCGVGCSFEMWTRGRHILKVQGVPEAPANGVSTCIKGKFGWDHVNHPDRLTKPLIRGEHGFREVEWDEALAFIARRLQEVRAAHGPDALAFVGSSKCTNEENYLIQKLARAVIGTNNVDNCSRYCQNPATMGLQRTVGYGGDAGSYADIEQADLVLIVGSNTAENHPVLASKIKRQRKLHGQQLIVADLRRHEMAERADIFLRPNSSTDMIWLQAITRYIIEQGGHDTTFLTERVNGFADYVDSLTPFTLEDAERRTGIPVQALRETAEAIMAAERVCALWAMGITQHSHGSDTSTAISNLLLVTGNYGRPGTGGYPLRGHNNVQGASDFGALCHILPGYDDVTDAQARARFAAGWGVDSLPAQVGYNNHEMIERVHGGALKAMYIMGEDMAIVDANANYVQAGLAQLELLVVQDLFFTRTAEFADVVLPSACSVEKEGTFTNSERRIQHLQQVLTPLPGTRPDWQILTELAARLGHRWGYTHPSQIMAEAARLTPMFAGVSYERLQGWNSLQWPVAADGTDSPLLYTERFHFPDGKARLFPIEWQAPEEKQDDEYDLWLNNGRVLEHFHEAALTGKHPGFLHKLPDTFVEISPELAAERALATGMKVRLISRRGAVKVGVHVTDRVRGRELYMPMNSTVHLINLLTGNHADPVVDTPAFKEIAVRLERLDDTRHDDPLPRANFRHYERVPVPGVQVDRKWRRQGYEPPPAPKRTKELY